LSLPKCKSELLLPAQAEFERLYIMAISTNKCHRLPPHQLISNIKSNNKINFIVNKLLCPCCLQVVAKIGVSYTHYSIKPPTYNCSFCFFRTEFDTYTTLHHESNRSSLQLLLFASQHVSKFQSTCISILCPVDLQRGVAGYYRQCFGWS